MSVTEQRAAIFARASERKAVIVKTLKSSPWRLSLLAEEDRRANREAAALPPTQGQGWV